MWLHYFKLFVTSNILSIKFYKYWKNKSAKYCYSFFNSHSKLVKKIAFAKVCHLFFAWVKKKRQKMRKWIENPVGDDSFYSPAHEYENELTYHRLHISQFSRFWKLNYKFVHSSWLYFLTWSIFDFRNVANLYWIR